MPAPLPENATPTERAKYRRAEERYLTENFKEGASQLPADVDPTDKRLMELRKRAGAFMELHAPYKASIWLALTRPVADLLSDVEQTRRFAASQRAGKSVGEYKVPKHSAAVEIGQKLVAMAIEGDMTALALVADRIEGKTGLRKGDEDPNESEMRKRTQVLTSKVIEMMTAGAVAAKANDAKVIDAEVTEIPSGKETE